MRACSPHDAYVLHTSLSFFLSFFFIFETGDDNRISKSFDTGERIIVIRKIDVMRLCRHFVKEEILSEKFF